MLDAPDDVAGWRDAARALAAERVPPEEIVWQVGGSGDLFAGDAVSPDVAPSQRLTVPRPFLDLAEHALLHCDPERFALLYTALLRLQSQPRLLDDRADPLVRRIAALASAVRRDIHKMQAFLRFREVQDAEGARYVAWFEPEHHIVRANAGFFVERFTTMRWSILTPEVSLHWDGAILREGPGAARGDAPGSDPTEALWHSYYASIFNPARVKIGAMLKEMPRRYWKNMPETALIPRLIASAQARETRMIDTPRPRIGSNVQAAWEALREEAAGCTRCPLYKDATQTVFGEGPVSATMMLVGEQPGDQEDLAGKPFVGPAGQMLDKALAEAGVDRAKTYVTNAVKHFKFEQRGKRRIHSKPNAGEISACRWWYEHETALIAPKVTVAMGATAARSVFDRPITISRERGRAHELASGGLGWVTVHPSFLLRMPDRSKAEEEYARFVEDLRGAQAVLAGS